MYATLVHAPLPEDGDAVSTRPIASYVKVVAMPVWPGADGGRIVVGRPVESRSRSTR